MKNKKEIIDPEKVLEKIIEMQRMLEFLEDTVEVEDLSPGQYELIKNAHEVLDLLTDYTNAHKEVGD